MKKIFILGLSVVLLTTGASAQRGPGDRFRHQRITQGFNNGQLTRSEKFHIQRDELRYKMEQRNAGRDGFVSPMERRKLYKIKRHDSYEMFRFKHNGRRKVI